MDFKLAKMNDLPQLKTMYKKIIDNMNKNNIKIWDEIFPCEFFHEDIKNENLYILTEKDEIVAAYALWDSNDGENYLHWKDVKEKALYINRFGVNVNYLSQGIGDLMLKKAIELANQKGIKYLRLLVVDINIPAINLYLKTGFKRVDGIFEERVDDFILREYGFEIEV